MSTILLVDDDAAARTTCAALLELDGHVVRECGTLADARRLLQSGLTFAVVVLDRTLPDGTGDTFVAEVRAAQPAARIIVASGDLAGAQHLDVDGHYGKGGDPSELLRVVSALLTKGDQP